MLSDIEWSVLFAGAAAVFSMLAVVVGRLNYADDELSRQNRIENRIINRGRRLEYERPPRSRSAGSEFPPGAAVFLDEEPEFNFQVVDVLVNEHRGWRYLAEKILYRFDGEISVSIESTKWDTMSSSWIRETPPDFEKIENFDFEKQDMTYELREDDNVVIVTFHHADVDRVSGSISLLLDHIENELASAKMDWGIDSV